VFFQSAEQLRFFSLEYCHIETVRERPFNLKGGGGIVIFLKKYSDFGGGKKKKSDSEFLSYKLMLNSGKKIHASRDKKKL
jgi:hypothetical protein